MTILIVAGFTALALLALIGAAALAIFLVVWWQDRAQQAAEDAWLARMNPRAWNEAQDRAGVEQVREMVRQRDLKRQEGT